MASQEGVYFRREDYGPFWTRALADLIDLAVFAVVSLLLSLPVLFLSLSDRVALDVVLMIWVGVALCYFVILKRSRIHTFGYRIGRIRTVGLDGKPPSYLSLVLRLCFGMLGPLNWLLDLIWISNDDNRQALRDKFAKTYVIKANAQPAGYGKIVFRYYSICGGNWLFQEVESAAPAANTIPTRN